MSVITPARRAQRNDRHRSADPASLAPVLLRVEGLTSRTPDGTVVLDDVTFSVRRGSLVAVVGPTGAGKSTLLNALTGAVRLDTGTIHLDGRRLAGDDESARRRVGYVPQDATLHDQLGLRRTLEYVATLRLPPTLGREEREGRVDAVLAELGLTSCEHVPISSLSGGQRKRASLAVELLAQPDLVILDEPTSGLDPGYEKTVLTTLRNLADAGRTVITVTHSVQALELCDQVLFLAAGGRMAFFGPPSEALAYFGDGDVADVFLALDGPGQAWHDRFRADPAYERNVCSPGGLTVDPRPRARSAEAVRSATSQLGVLVRRYLNLIRSDRRQLTMLAVQGPLLGLLLFAVLSPGSLHPGAGSVVTPAIATVALFVTISATWLGTGNGIREIVKEQRIFRREQSSGLSVGAYVVSKIAVLGTLSMAQAAILAAIATGRQDIPSRGSALGSGRVEIMVAAALAALAAVALGLLLSAMVSTTDKAMTMLPLALVAQLVLSGAVISTRMLPGLRQLASFTGAHWGVQAVQATAAGDSGAWWSAIGALLGLTAASLLVTTALILHRLHPVTARRRDALGLGLTATMALGTLAVAVVIVVASPPGTSSPGGPRHPQLAAAVTATVVRSVTQSSSSTVAAEPATKGPATAPVRAPSAHSRAVHPTTASARLTRNSAPTTGAPTTGVPPTGVPPTGAPTTGGPTTGVPPTGAPTTGAPSSAPPSTVPPPTGAGPGPTVSTASRSNAYWSTLWAWWLKQAAPSH